MSHTKKLIEVALPLDIINDISGFDKMPVAGDHPKGIHHWWARLPLPTARAILFASLVDDPSAHPNKFPTEEAQLAERERLFEIIRKLCQKKIHTKQKVFEEAHLEILKHCNGKLPTLLDPFAGGGSIPLEGMRLGLPVQASDLNPVAVLINKAQLEILPEFANQIPINPSIKGKEAFTEWKLGKGIAEDLRYYGNLVNEEAKKRIGQYYPKVKVGNKELDVIAWLWARTLICPNPACGCEMPLVRSFILSTKKKPNYYSRPILERSANGNKVIGFEVLQGSPEISGTVNRNGATCIGCNEPVKLEYIRVIGRQQRLGEVLIAVVAEQGNKVFLSPTKEQTDLLNEITPQWKPETQLPEKALGFRVQAYGMDQHYKLFNNRQLLGFATLQELISELYDKIKEHGGSSSYAKAIQFYLNRVVVPCKSMS
ncbi:MAG: hypothetical protein KIPDCIKN_00002 [Haliscomenobacter sp.]|nr:hypothetical protein [Haliscomenobacter sp.]